MVMLLDAAFGRPAGVTRRGLRPACGGYSARPSARLRSSRKCYSARAFGPACGTNVLGIRPMRSKITELRGVMFSRSARVRVGAWIVSGALLTTLAQAEPSAGDKATAQALFDQGKQLAAAGKVSDACPKFEESQRLDPG